MSPDSFIFALLVSARAVGSCSCLIRPNPCQRPVGTALTLPVSAPAVFDAPAAGCPSPAPRAGGAFAGLSGSRRTRESSGPDPRPVRASPLGAPSLGRHGRAAGAAGPRASPARRKRPAPQPCPLKC